MRKTDFRKAQVNIPERKGVLRNLRGRGGQERQSAGRAVVGKSMEMGSRGAGDGLGMAKWGAASEGLQALYAHFCLYF